MYANQYEEHMAHSAPCSSRWDGFDRGDTGILRTTHTCIGRMTNPTGQRVAITHVVTEDGWGDSFGEYVVTVSGKVVFTSEDHDKAIRAAKWWMADTRFN